MLLLKGASKRKIVSEVTMSIIAHRINHSRVRTAVLSRRVKPTAQGGTGNIPRSNELCCDAWPCAKLRSASESGYRVTSREENRESNMSREARDRTTNCWQRPG